MLFFSLQNLEDTEACRQSSCYSNRDVNPLMCCLRHLPCWWPDLKSYVRLSATAQLEFPLSPRTGYTFQKAELFWQPGLVPFISLLLGNWNLSILVQAEVQLAKGLWAARTEVTFTVWNSFDAVWILLVWDAAGETPVSAQLVEAMVWKTQTFGVSRQVKPSHWLFISLDVVVPKSQTRAQVLGLDCNERLGSVPAEMGVPQLHCLPSCFLGTISDTSHLSCVPFCTPTLPTQSESWVLSVRWFKILVAGAFTTWDLERKQTWSNFPRTAALNGELKNKAWLP